MSDWLEAERRVERAQQLSESQLWAEALEEIEAALAINPNNSAWHAHRGCILDELERWDEAAEAFENALQLEPGDPDIALALGATLSRLRRFGRALKVFEELARVNPDLEPAYCHRIGVYAELGRHDQAEEMFYMAQELDDACPHCFFHMGGSLAAREQFDRAIYCWRRVLELDPDYIGVNRRIARAYRAQGQSDLAREYYLREVRDDPGDTDVLFELAEMTLESGKLARAAARFAHILELDPDHIASHFALGRIWLLRNQPEAALRCFEAIETVTDDAEIPALYGKLGEALFRLGRYRDAREPLERAVEHDPDDISAMILLGNCLVAIGKPREGADMFRRVLALDADHAVAHQCLAVCLFGEGRFEAGLEHSRQALRSRPDFAVAMHTAARGHLQLAHWREARAMIRRALKLDPENSDLRELQKRILRYRIRHALGRLFGPFRRFF